MSNIDSLLERLRATYETVSRIEESARLNHEDQLVLANLESVKRVAAQLEAEWDEACRKESIEVCRYRIINEFDSEYSLSSVASSLLHFQELFTQIYDSIINGPKKRSRISGEIITESLFNFGFTYPGSLGITIYQHSEQDLLSGKFDESVVALFDITDVKDEFEVRDLAKTLGDAVVKKVFDWSQSNYRSGFDLDLSWTSTAGTKKGGLIDRKQLGHLVNIISMTSDVEKRKFGSSGTLVGIDTKQHRFRFVDKNGSYYTGTLSDAFPYLRKWSVNTDYYAEIEVEAVTSYATMNTKQTYSLLSLKQL